MSVHQQERPMRHVMVWARAFRAPLQATFTPDDADASDAFTALLEEADKRVSKSGPATHEN